MRRHKLAYGLLAFALAASLCLGQQASRKLTNKDVMDLVALGFSDDTILDKIHSAEATGFDTSISALKALKAAKVSEPVIRAMMNPHPGAGAAPAPAPLPPPTPAAEPVPAEPAPTAPPVKLVGHLPAEVGLYVMRKGRLAEMDPEIVGWQTGGALKHVATLGLDKGHVNGKVMNSKSPLQLACPVEFIIKTPEGTSATEYQLLHLDQKEDRREFRAVTGGVVHSSGGAERNLVSFESEKIGNRVWRIAIKNLPQGEYGFLPPGVNSASLSSSGKIYSFGVME
jgi:hypothetical protein